MDTEDKNPVLLLVLIGVVAVVVFIGILAVTWQAISGPVGDTLSSLALFRQVRSTDYNFEIPEIVVEEVEPEEEEIVEPEEIDRGNIVELAAYANLTEDEFNYNFRVPKRDVSAEDIGVRDAILDDALQVGYATGGADSGQSRISVQIPSVGINSPVWQGFGANNLLEKGFWVYPFSSEVGQGEVVMLCHRRYFGPNDPRTCWNLDKATVGDRIFISSGDDVTLTYEIVGTTIYSENDPNIYNISETEDAIRIVTCNPLYDDYQRLVVLAKRVRST